MTQLRSILVLSSLQGIGKEGRRKGGGGGGVGGGGGRRHGLGAPHPRGGERAVEPTAEGALVGGRRAQTEATATAADAAATPRRSQRLGSLLLLVAFALGAGDRHGTIGGHLPSSCVTGLLLALGDMPSQ